MSELEARIEHAQQRETDQQHRLNEANRSLHSVDSVLQQKSGMSREGEQFLKTYGEQARAGLDTVEAQLAARRRSVDVARGGFSLANAALLAGGDSATAPDLLALALLQEEQRDRVRIASRQILELEARRAELAGKSEHARTSAQYQSVFSQYSLKQLRARHEALARQVAQAQTQADAQTVEVHKLAGRREQLKELVARLAEHEAARTAEATPTPSPSPTPALVSPSVSRVFLTPVVTPLSVQAAATPRPDAALAEVPYEEGGAPVASQVPAAEDKDQTDSGGTRFLFWRARPVGVHALAVGKVLFSGPFAGYRHLLIIDHGGGWRSLYGNLIQCSVSAGGAVQAGQEVGRYQAVQGSRAEPLWFEVRRGVQAVAPEAWPALAGPWQGRLFGLLADSPAG